MSICCNNRIRKTSDCEAGICFSAVINEQTPDEIGQKALKARVCEFYDIILIRYYIGAERSECASRSVSCRQT